MKKHKQDEIIYKQTPQTKAIYIGGAFKSLIICCLPATLHLNVTPSIISSISVWQGLLSPWATYQDPAFTLCLLQDYTFGECRAICKFSFVWLHPICVIWSTQEK